MELETNVMIVLTGNGKGKTTSAIGQAIRMLGYNKRVVMIQFLKGQEYGEIRYLKKEPLFTIEQYGRDVFVNPDNPAKEDIELAKKGWERVKYYYLENTPDLLIIDELNVAIFYKLIDKKEVLELFKKRPLKCHIFITGRWADEDLLEIADTVSKVNEVKHHYQKKIKFQKGIEL